MCLGYQNISVNRNIDPEWWRDVCFMTANLQQRKTRSDYWIKLKKQHRQTQSLLKTGTVTLPLA
jgi:hypothetical protein